MASPEFTTPLRPAAPAVNPATPAVKLDIIEVSWGRTVNTGNYENVRFDLTARVGSKGWKATLIALKAEAARIEQGFIKAK